MVSPNHSASPGCLSDIMQLDPLDYHLPGRGFAPPTHAVMRYFKSNRGQDFLHPLSLLPRHWKQFTLFQLQCSTLTISSWAPTKPGKLGDVAPITCRACSAQRTGIVTGAVGIGLSVLICIAKAIKNIDRATPASTISAISASYTSVTYSSISAISRSSGGRI